MEAIESSNSQEKKDSQQEKVPSKKIEENKKKKKVVNKLPQLPSDFEIPGLSFTDEKDTKNPIENFMLDPNPLEFNTDNEGNACTFIDEQGDAKLSRSDSQDTNENNFKSKSPRKPFNPPKNRKKIPDLPPLPPIDLDFDMIGDLKMEEIKLPKNDPPKKNAPFDFSALDNMGDMLDMDLNSNLNSEEYLNVLITPKNTPKQMANVSQPSKISDIKRKEEIKSTPEKDLMPTSCDKTPRVELGDFLSSEFDVHQMDPIEFDSKKTKSQNFHFSEFTFSGSTSLQSLNNVQKDKILLKLLKERGSYKEKLRIAESEIITKEYHIERMKKDGNNFPDICDQRLHLAFLFSSPLIRRTKASIENIMQLDYLTEINDILKV